MLFREKIQILHKYFQNEKFKVESVELSEGPNEALNVAYFENNLPNVPKYLPQLMGVNVSINSKLRGTRAIVVASDTKIGGYSQDFSVSDDANLSRLILFKAGCLDEDEDNRGDNGGNKTKDRKMSSAQQSDGPQGSQG